jgi:hypothetical protein
LEQLIMSLSMKSEILQTLHAIKSKDGTVCLGDFYAVLPLNQFMHMPTRDLWSTESVNAMLPPVPGGQKRNGKQATIKPTSWLIHFRHAEQVTWAPGLPAIVEDHYILDGGWNAHPGARCLNTYRPPPSLVGDATQARPWIEHMRLLYPEEADETMDWMAHRVQHPARKINHGVIMGGLPGIGKDWLLQALKLAVGTWNFQEASPTDLLTPYNPFVKAIVLRLNEAHDLGEGGRIDRYALYERLKVYAAAPPDVLACVDKYIRRHYVPNVLGLIITTNHKPNVLGLIITTNHKDGIYLPPEDRRYLVGWSNCTKEQFDKEFWDKKWQWMLHEGGAEHIAAYLMQRDLSAFNPYKPPRATAAFFEAVNVSQPPEDAELADVLDSMEKDENGQPCRPTVCTLFSVATSPGGAALEWLLDRRQRRSIPHRLGRCGYIACRNPDAEDGLWRINGRRQTLYVKITLTAQERLEAAKDYVLRETKTSGSS